MTEEVLFQTKDKVMIFGNWVHPEHPKAAALLLHMMPADKTSWRVLQDVLSGQGIASLAIDMRGHGKSVKKGTEVIDYKQFSDFEHQDTSLDIEASLQFLRKKGFKMEHIIVIGASFGANLALQTAVQNPAMPVIVLLSPGENFRGVETYTAASELRPEQAILTAGSAGDDQRSYDAARIIVEKAPSQNKEFKAYTSAGHGTNIFQQDQNLPGYIAGWVADKLRLNA